MHRLNSEVKMNGITFFKTKTLKEIVSFYSQALKMSVWLQQKDCTILQKGNLLLGFCQRDSADTQGMITFFTESCEDVDNFYEYLKDIACAPPKMNDKYGIYHFFSRDSEGRDIEIQWFGYSLKSFRSGRDLLVTRRSIRKYSDEPVSDELLMAVLNSGRYAPSSRNSQPVSYAVIRNPQLLCRLARIRSGSAVISNAPLALAIISDPEISSRHIQDGNIAAYHFMLSAWDYGLGTCWIGDMDRPEVKEMLQIPASHYVSTVTPVGWPAEKPIPKERDVVRLKIIE
jgi:nitroreductase